VVGVNEVVFGANNACLRVAKFTNIGVENLNIETTDEIVTDARFAFVRLRLPERTSVIYFRWKVTYQIILIHIMNLISYDNDKKHRSPTQNEFKT